jgi:hypothetical protein
MLHVEHTWGYFLEQMETAAVLNLCDECFDEITKGFLIPTEFKDA